MQMYRIVVVRLFMFDFTVSLECCIIVIVSRTVYVKPLNFLDVMSL